MRSWPERRERRARIEIIPMIDVMMFLLVFFVLISTNVLPALGLKINPPSSAKADRVVDRKKIMIGIERGGATSLDGVATPVGELAARIRALSNDEQISVTIAGDGASELQNLVDVLDALKAAGVASAAIVAKAK